MDNIDDKNFRSINCINLKIYEKMMLKNMFTVKMIFLQLQLLSFVVDLCILSAHVLNLIKQVVPYS